MLDDAKESTSTNREDDRKWRKHDQDEWDDRIKHCERKRNQEQENEATECDESVRLSQSVSKSIQHARRKRSRPNDPMGGTLQQREPQEAMA